MAPTEIIPTLGQIKAVRLAINVEAWPAFPGTPDDPPDPKEVLAAIEQASRAIRDYLSILHHVLPDADPRHERIDEDADKLMPSNYDINQLCVEGFAYITLTPEEWLRAADFWSIDLCDKNFIYDLDHIPALPSNSISATHGQGKVSWITPLVYVQASWAVDILDSNFITPKKGFELAKDALKALRALSESPPTPCRRVNGKS